MPELPEVDHAARTLNTLVTGRRIREAELRRARLAPDTDPNRFAADLCGASINFVHRRGKHILIDLDNGRTLIVHLRMSGRFLLLPAEIEFPKFAHAIFYLADGMRLVFDDKRHFGLMKIVETSALAEAKELRKLAPEPFSDEFSLRYFSSVLSGSKRSLKDVLIDQTRICGLGNIYACEAMFAARIDPRVTGASLSRPKAARMFEAVRLVLGHAMELSRRSGFDPENIDGHYSAGEDDRGWLVYDREGESCVNCNSPIVRVKQGARSTYFCGRCQRK